MSAPPFPHTARRVGLSYKDAAVGGEGSEGRTAEPCPREVRTRPEDTHNGEDVNGEDVKHGGAWELVWASGARTVTAAALRYTLYTRGKPWPLSSGDLVSPVGSTEPSGCSCELVWDLCARGAGGFY